MSFGRDAGWVLLSRASVLLLGLVQSVVLARYLHPEGRGEYAILLWIPQLLVIMLPMGIQWSTVYYLREGSHPRPQVLQTAATISLILGGAGMVLAMGIGFSLADSFLAGFSTGAMVAAAALVPVRVIDGFARGALRGLKEISTISLLNTVRPVLILVGVGLVIVVTDGGVSGLVAVVLVAEAAIVVAAFFLAFKGTPLRLRLEAAVAGPLLNYGIRIYLYSVLLFLNYRLDMGLIRYYLGYEEVGYYATAVVLAELIWNLPQSLTFVLFPYITGVTEEEKRVLTLKVCRISTALVGSACIAVAACAYPAIYLLYGAEFIPAVWPLLALLPGIFMMSVQQVLGVDLSSRNMPGKVTIAALVGLVVNVGLNVLLIPRWGIVGAAVASSISYGCVTGVVAYYYCVASHVPISEAIIPRMGELKESFLYARMKLAAVIR